MAERQLSFTANEVAHLVNRANVCFREGAFSKAIRVLERALRLDAGLTSVASALKCATFWAGSRGAPGYHHRPVRAGPSTLEQQWELFQPFAGRLEDMSERTLFDIRRYVMSECLRGYRNLPGGASGAGENADLLLRIGRSYKGLGNYASAIEHLEAASGKTPSFAGGPGRVGRLLRNWSMKSDFRACCSAKPSSSDPIRSSSSGLKHRSSGG